MRSQGPPTDQRAGEQHKRLVNLWPSLISDTQLAKLMQPREGSLNHPAIHAKAAAMFRVSLRQHWLNSSLPQLQTVRLRIIGPVTLHPFGPLPGSATLAFDRRNGLDQRQQLRHVMRVGGAQNHRQRNALRLSYDVMLAPRFRFISRVWAGFGPPFRARSAELSTTARDQSICSELRSRASNNSGKRCHTPAACQSRRRRKQVMPLP